MSVVSSPAVMAHRGASKAEPENTVAAFQRAGAMGAHAVELDVRRTSDGVLVVHHNPHLHDLRLIAATPYADLPDAVPTLGEALDACAGMWVNVEIKNDPEEPDFDPTESIADETIAHLLARHRHTPADRRRQSAPRTRPQARCRVCGRRWLPPGNTRHRAGGSAFLRCKPIAYAAVRR